MSEAPEKRPRRWVTVTCWVLAGDFGLWAIVRVLGLEAGIFPIVQLVAYTPYAILLALVAAVIVALLRRWVQAGILAAIVLVLAVLVLPRELGAPEEIEGGHPVRVLTANLLKGNADTEALLELARDRNADIVLLQEIPARKVRELERSGFGDAYPHRALDVTVDAGGGAVFSRWPLRQLESLSTGHQPRAAVDVPGAHPIEVVSIHPTAPILPGTTAEWDRDFRSMPSAFSSDRPLVLAGDFNATLDHENLQDLIGTGYRDAAEVVGAGLTSTWPPRPKLSWRRLSLPVTIDHVLAEEGISVSDYAVEGIRGSDHRAVFAELVLPPAPGRS